MGLLSCVKTCNKSTNSNNALSNQNTKDENFHCCCCLTWMTKPLDKLFTCGRGIDGYGPNDASSHACINSIVLDAGKPLSDDISLLDDEIPNGHRIPSEDKALHDDSMPSGNSDKNLLHLPSDIIMNILSRLSIKSDALQCRRVCRPLFEMMSTPYFTTMINRNRATPILVLQPLQDYSLRFKTHDSKTGLYACNIVLHIIHEGNNRILTRRVEISLNNVTEDYSFEPELIASYNGLLLFKNRTEMDFFIINPITQEQVVVKGPLHGLKDCGVYFHSPTSEYRIIYMVESSQKPYSFYILSPKSKSFREIFNYTNVAPCTCRYPVMLNGALHWMASVGDGYMCRFFEPLCYSNSILVFNLESEEFITMSYPESEYRAKETQRTSVCVQLLEMEGHLCLCYTSTSTGEGQVWVLENYRKIIWTKRHVINIKSLISEHVQHDYHWSPSIEAIRIHNDELLLRLHMSYLYYYNLKLHTLRKVERGNDAALLQSVVVHYNSLASLQSESAISLEDLVEGRLYKLSERLFIRI